MKNIDTKTVKVTAIILAVVLAAIFVVYNIGVGVGMTRQKKTMEDQIFKACAVTQNDKCNMTIGDVRYVIEIEH